MKTNLFGRISRYGISITRRHQHISSAALRALFLGLLCSFARGAEGAPHTNGPTRQDLARIERRGQREYQQRIFPLEQIPAGARSRALEQIRQAEALRADSPKAGGGFHWSNIGPSPIHDTTSPDAAGRVSAIAVDPGSASHWLAGAAQGGIWESMDGGATWVPRSDDAPSLAIGSIAFAPSNAKIVYAGTGEANFSADSYAGMGLLKSLDGGTSWFVVATNFAETAFSEIKIHSSNPNYLVAATARGVLGVVEFGTNIPPAAPSRGIFVSHDGGTNWTHTLFGEATDVEIDRGNFDHQYAALGEILGAPTNGVYRSVNGGTNWIRINGPWSASGAANIGRIEMALAPFTPNRLYVSVAGKRVPGSATDLLGIWRTDNAWDPTPAWTQISTLVSPDPGSFPWYSHDLLVHPANPDVVYFAGITVWRFDGSSWQQLPNQHPDQHKLAWVPTFDPSVFRLLATHDGGISSRYDNFGAWSSHLKGLVITQIYKGAVHPGDSSVILGASQDNGTEVYNGSPGWNIVLGGDGYSCAISTAQPNKYWAASHQNYGATTIYRTQDGKNFSSASFGIDSSTISFFIDFVKHPVSDDIFVAGAINLWRCENFFSATVPEWTSNSPVLKTLDGRDAEVSAIAFAPSDLMGRIYAYGTEVGQLRLTTNAGANWVDIDLGHNVPDRYVSGLAFSPSDPKQLFVTLSGFDEGTPAHPGHVFKTTNALTANPFWLNVSPPVNLPQDCIAINPVNAAEVFVGSDIGIWSSSDAGKSWIHHGPSSGLPNVAVYDLQFDTNGKLTAFTHGRGAFVYRLNPIIIPPLCAIGPCWPGWINPGDLVTVYLPLRNEVADPTVNLIAQLRATPQIMPLGGSQLQAYGALSANGETIVRQFQFQANVGVPAVDPLGAAAGCGGIVVANFDLQDNGQPLGSIAIPFQVGRLTQPLVQDFEGSRLPSPPSGWFSRAANGQPPWTTTSNAPPNVIVPGDPDEVSDQPPRTTGPVSISAFVIDAPGAGLSYLYSPLIPITTSQAQLTFRHSFDLPKDADGGVLEIQVGTQPFSDILQAGGSFASNPYNTTLIAGSGPGGGRAAWSGNSGGWLITRANLPPGAAQQNVQFRWTSFTGSTTGGNGWFIDDVAVSEYPCAPPVTHPVLLRPGFFETGFGFYLDTTPGRAYYLEFKDSLGDNTWQLLQTLQGDGTEQFVGDFARGLKQRFYRFRVE